MRLFAQGDFLSRQVLPIDTLQCCMPIRILL